MRTWIRAKLNKIIREEINSGKRFAVCPYGEWGMVLTDLLQKGYGLDDVLIFDNGLSDYNSAIHSVQELQEMNTEEIVLILTSISTRNSDEINKQIRALDIPITIRDILEPEIKECSYKSQYFHDLKNLLLCKKVKNQKPIRIGGSEGDGGYVMIDDFKNSICAYSFGIGSNVSWDMDIAIRDMKVFMYDHTIYHLPQVHNNFIFKKLGVGEGEGCISLTDILKSNDHLNNHNLIMKMDIEGGEWDVLTNTPSQLLNNFKQITLELHDLCNQENGKKIFNVLKKINLTHQAIWVHGNNGNEAQKAGGILIPNLLEITYLRKDSYLFESADCVFPMLLDLPNLMYRHDFVLGNWGG